MGLRSELISCVKIMSHAHALNLNLLNLGIVILEFAHAIREEKNPLMEKPGHSVYSGSQLTYIFWAHNVTEPRPDQLKQPQIVTLPPTGLHGRHYRQA